MPSAMFSSLILGSVVIGSVALAQTAEISTSSVVTGCNINDYASPCATDASAPTDFLSGITISTTPSATTTIETPYILTNTSITNATITRTSNLPNMSTTLTSSVVSTTSSMLSYLNTSIITLDTSISIPTSILIATGTPTPESGVAIGPLTVTSFAYVTPGATGPGSSKTSITPTQASTAGMGKKAGLSGLLCFVLGVSGLLLA